LGDEVGYTSDGGNTLENMFGDRNEFIYPKPVSLMSRVLQVASQPDSIVMDFFAGSGTFGHAALEMNRDVKGSKRRFILVTNNENSICDKVTFPRLKKVIDGYLGKDKKRYEPCPASLTYYKVNE
jgi:adenine-specific DNA-methyltransferase